MAVYREHGPGNERINVGHIPIELSSTLRFFVKHGGNISAKVRQKNYRASNLEQGGLEVPITVKCAIPDRATHEKTETTYKQTLLAIQTTVSTTTQERKCVNNITGTRPVHCYILFRCAATIPVNLR